MTDGLVLLHGWPLDGSMWEPQVSALGAQLTVVAPHAPGFGGEPLSGSVVGMDDIADAAAEAADRAGLDRVVVAGLSMGGYAALAFWRRHRDRVAGLILANTRSGADDEAGKERRRATADRLRTEGSGFLVTSPPPLLSADAPRELWNRLTDIIARQPAEAVAAAALGMAERPDSTPDLGGIDVPVLVVGSTGDTLIPLDATAPMADLVPGARLAVLEGAGHISNVEAPDGFTAELRRHLVEAGVLPA